LLHVKAGEKIVVYPRRGFDLWNTRYFILPAFAGDWKDPDRGYAAFLPNAEVVYPLPSVYDGPGGAERREQWTKNKDYQILRNLNEYPRAWVVHSARFLNPIEGMGRAER